MSKQRIKIILSEDASAKLIELMEHFGFSNPTHTANIAISDLHKMKILFPSKEENNNGNSEKENLHRM